MTDINRFENEEFLKGLYDDLKIEQIMNELSRSGSSQQDTSAGKSTNAYEFSVDDWSKPALIHDQFKKDLDINDLIGGMVDIKELTLTDYNFVKNAVQPTEEGASEGHPVEYSFLYKEYEAKEESLFAGDLYRNENPIISQDLFNSVNTAADETPFYIEAKSDAKDNWDYNYDKTSAGVKTLLSQASVRNIFGQDSEEKWTEKNLNVTATHTQVYVSHQSNLFSQ